MSRSASHWATCLNTSFLCRHTHLQRHPLYRASGNGTETVSRKGGAEGTEESKSETVKNKSDTVAERGIASGEKKTESKATQRYSGSGEVSEREAAAAGESRSECDMVEAKAIQH
jgi:hypothetical protein